MCPADLFCVCLCACMGRLVFIQVRSVLLEIHVFVYRNGEMRHVAHRIRPYFCSFLVLRGFGVQPVTDLIDLSAAALFKP